MLLGKNILRFTAVQIYHLGKHSPPKAGVPSVLQVCMLIVHPVFLHINLCFIAVNLYSSSVVDQANPGLMSSGNWSRGIGLSHITTELYCTLGDKRFSFRGQQGLRVLATILMGFEPVLWPKLHLS